MPGVFFKNEHCLSETQCMGTIPPLSPYWARTHPVGVNPNLTMLG
jgi:hypothetical protein